MVNIRLMFHLNMNLTLYILDQSLNLDGRILIDLSLTQIIHWVQITSILICTLVIMSMHLKIEKAQYHVRIMNGLKLQGVEQIVSSTNI